MTPLLRRAVDAVVGCVPGVEYRAFPDSGGRDTSHERIDVPALIDFAAPAPGLRILEIGCGRGIALPVIAARCAPRRLAAIDIDARLLGEATQRLAATGTDATLVLGDVRAMPFEAASFDLVIDFGTCYHIARSAQAIAEIARVVAPGGRFVYETRRAQLASHPLRARLRAIDWSYDQAFGPEHAGDEYAVRVRR